MAAGFARRLLGARLISDLFKTQPRLGTTMGDGLGLTLQRAADYLTDLLKSDGRGCVKTAAV